MRNIHTRGILILLLTILLSACVTHGPIGLAPAVGNGDFATVHIARPTGFTGCGVNTRIQYNHSDFYGLACGDHISFRVPSNKQMTISQTTSMSPDHIKILPEKGETIYMVNDCIPFVGCGLSEVEKAAFRTAASKCDDEVKIGY